ncbi:MAG: SDR family oxidoreductase [Pseudomonadales bacterium]|nr:SDR family oxidoreductase [Pseudomonadales bacterium]
MKTFAMTGGATGIGAAVKEQLIARGDKVVVVDIKNANIEADLSTSEGRQHAIDQLQVLCAYGIDGFIACAGLGPHVTPFSLITQVNFFGATVVIEGITALLKAKQGSVVVVSSNSAALPGLNDDYLNALLNNDEDKACEIIADLDGHNAYAGSKNALARWMRRKTPELMAQGIRINAVAPGMTVTPLTDQVFADETYGQAMQDFSKMIPAGFMATPEMIADSIVFLLDPASRYVCGSVLFVDGGQDALLRADNF